MVGCVSQNYFINRTLDAQDSLWGFFRNEVVPSMFPADQVVLFGTDAWRYDLFGKEVRLDDVLAVSPFNNSLVKWDNVPAETVAALNASLNVEPNNWMPQLPNFILASAKPFEAVNRLYTLVIDGFEQRSISDHLAKIWPNHTDFPVPTLIPGATTSSIWIDYFSEVSSTCSKTGSWYNKPSNAHQSGENGLSGLAGSNPNADPARLVFVAVAVVVVAALSTVAVWQKGARFQYMAAEREQATMAALREFEGETGLYMDETEGEFV